MIPACLRHPRAPSPVCPVCLRLLVSWAAAVEKWAREVLEKASATGGEGSKT